MSDDDGFGKNFKSNNDDNFNDDDYDNLYEVVDNDDDLGPAKPFLGNDEESLFSQAREPDDDDDNDDDDDHDDDDNYYERFVTNGLSIDNTWAHLDQGHHDKSQ